jgi:SAM-dependent methyltransferase
MLLCPNCGSVVRERAVALILREILPDWRNRAIHESSPASRSLSARMPREARGYVATHFYPDQPLGTIIHGFRNENLESQTFESNTFDLVLTLDVMEHVFDPSKVYAEIWRTLKPGGCYLHTFPIQRYLVKACIPLAKLMPDGTVKHLIEHPEYHGNPIDLRGSLVTHDYGYDISKAIAQWAPFDVRISRFWDETHGVIGEYTEAVVCRKRG